MSDYYYDVIIYDYYYLFFRFPVSCVFLVIYGIPYMKKVTEFREIPRNFTELYDTEFGGIPPEF
jgi:hypothetical protein